MELGILFHENYTVGGVGEVVLLALRVELEIIKHVTPFFF